MMFAHESGVREHPSSKEWFGGVQASLNLTRKLPILDIT